MLPCLIFISCYVCSVLKVFYRNVRIISYNYDVHIVTKQTIVQPYLEIIKHLLLNFHGRSSVISIYGNCDLFGVCQEGDKVPLGEAEGEPNGSRKVEQKEILKKQKVMIVKQKVIQNQLKEFTKSPRVKQKEI